MSDSRPLRVLHLGNPFGMYGAERWILALIRHLPREVHSVLGVVQDAPGPRPPLLVHGDVLGFPTVNFTSYGKLSFSAIGQLRDYINAEQIDVVHSHGYKTDILAALATKGGRCHSVATPHGWSTGAGLRLQLYEALDRIAMHFHSAVAPLSKDLLDGLYRFPLLRSRLRLIENGVDISEIESVAEVDPQIAAWRAAGHPIVGFIGQLIPRKGVDVLLRAFAQANVANAKLCLVGDGPEHEQLQQLSRQLRIEGSVAFLGFREDRLSALRGFDLMVLPSYLEGIPRCLMESMAAGVPILASDIPGVSTLLDGGRAGVLFPPGDVEELARHLEELLGDIDRRETLRRTGIDRVNEHYSAARMADKYLRLYRDLVRPEASGTIRA